MAASPSHSLGTFVIPSPERNDAEPVLGSLALAHAAFERGEIRDALKHLRRAAESADDAGSELRAVALARAAADLATEVGSLTPPPASAAQSGAHSVAPPVSSAAPRANADSALQQLLASGRAVKVVVKRSARDEELYVVRRAENQAAALGTREAVIVLLEPDDAFFESRPRAHSDVQPAAPSSSSANSPESGSSSKP